MKRQILNLTQHYATPDQVKAGVVEPPAEAKARIRRLLTFTSLPSYGEVERRAEELAELAVEILTDPDFPWICGGQNWMSVMIGGAPYLMAPLERALLRRGLRPLYAFSLREMVEEPQPDGSVRKTMVFRHLGWIEVSEEVETEETFDKPCYYQVSARGETWRCSIKPMWPECRQPCPDYKPI